MKSMMKNFALLSMGLLIYSCNEKISPELQNGSSTTVPTVIAPTDYYFKVTNNSAAVLNYVLHRSGPGMASTDCKINSDGTPLSSILYIGDAATTFDSKAYDIACYLEAEELSLKFNGLSFKVEASKNTCEYIGYSPYSFYDSIPGATTASWRGVTCADATAGTLDAQFLLPSLPFGRDILGAGVDRQIGCGEMVDTSIALAANRLIKAIPTDAQPLCAFDYAINGGGNSQNCDSGRMRFNITDVYKVTPPVPDPEYFTSKPVPTPDHICGGATASCVGGAIKSVSSLTTYVRGTEILNTQLNENFSKAYTLPALMGVRSTGVDIVNFRRGLASKHLNFLDYTVPNEVEWSDTNHNKAFDPSLMENYAANRTPDGSSIIDVNNTAATFNVSNATYEAKRIELGYTATPTAADPFLGTSRVNPFYTFYCLDRAYEIKARIRMVVRDWDKVFPSTASDKELISDVYKSVNARTQDLPSTEEEIPNDPGNFNYFNDMDDWDNLVLMTRTDPNLIGVYDPGFTFWSPTDGWWNPAIFPNQGPAN
jgi:hypothetical protein